jgi:8-oxo-dGTP diphosphatase
MTTGTEATAALFGLSGAVFVEREGKILVLKRAMGEVTGGWYIPGGAVERGEHPETAARRELFEEAGLTPPGPLELVGVCPMRAYGAPLLQIAYACECPEGDVVLSEEHSGARWMDPEEYRKRYFDDAILEAVAERDANAAGLIRAVRDGVDEYLAWRAQRTLDRRLRTMRLTAEVYVVRGDEILLLKRRGGMGEGVWYLPGGIVEPQEDPRDTAVRETLEETGLRIEAPELLRVWSFVDPEHGLDVFHATYLARAARGEVTLSNEHSASRWMTPSAYSARFWSDEAASAAPEWARWMEQVRFNCDLVTARIETAAAI